MFRASGTDALQICNCYVGDVASLCRLHSPCIYHHQEACGSAAMVSEVVLERTDPVPAATIAQRLEILGGVRIMSDVEQHNRQQADVLLRQAKESQKGSAATGANTISFLQSLAAIRGDGGSARKRGLVLQEVSSYVWKLCRGCFWVGAISGSSFAGHMKLPRLLF